MENREDVLQTIVSKAKELGFITDVEGFKRGVYEREEMIPTSIGFGVAIPHCKSTIVKSPFVAFARTKNPFLWDERNGELVDFIFLIGVPEQAEGNLHLKFLSSISRKLMNEDFRASLRNAPTTEEAFGILESINNTIKGGE